MDEPNSGVVTQETAAPAEIEQTAEVQTPEAASAETGEQTGAAEPAEEAIPDKVWETARKRAEREAQQRTERQIAERDRQFAERFKGYVNPITKQPIQSEADYFAALDAQKTLQTQRTLQEKGVDPSIIDEAVQNSPLVQAAGKVLERMQADEGNRMFDEQFTAIQKLDPRVTDLNALRALDTFPEFDKMVRSGMDMTSAYKLANFEYLTNTKMQSAQQAAINAARGKSHLSPTGGGAGSDSSMPEDVYEAEWKRYGFDRKTAAEFYKKFHNHKEG